MFSVRTKVLGSLFTLSLAAFGIAVASSNSTLEKGLARLSLQASLSGIPVKTYVPNQTQNGVLIETDRMRYRAYVGGSDTFSLFGGPSISGAAGDETRWWVCEFTKNNTVEQCAFSPKVLLENPNLSPLNTLTQFSPGKSTYTTKDAAGNIVTAAVTLYEFSTEERMVMRAGVGMEFVYDCGNSVVEAEQLFDHLNIQHSAETCDNGENNGTSCTPGYGSSCEYCDASCGLVVVDGSQCGDGTTNEPEEQCDDSNTVNGDGCSSTCQEENATECGNGIVEEREECDDGNEASLDGCNVICLIETGWKCTSTPVSNPESTCSPIDPLDNNDSDDDSDTEPGSPVCGNGDPSRGGGDTEEGEECDDGNLISGDGCSGTGHPSGPCTLEWCGDGYLDTDGIQGLWAEQCDDGSVCHNANHEMMKDSNGNLLRCTLSGHDPVCGGQETTCHPVSSDGCNTSCYIEYCGNGEIDFNGPDNILGNADDEECDDGSVCMNTNNEVMLDNNGNRIKCKRQGDIQVCEVGGGTCAPIEQDGCSLSCKLETGWICDYMPSVCTQVAAPEDDDVPPPPKPNICTDSDNGKDYAALGLLSVVNADSIMEVFEKDACKNSNTLIEWFCDGTVAASLEYNCPFGCENGSCLAKKRVQCGDGVIEENEKCDDANKNNGDGCSEICQVESGYSCSGSPSICGAKVVRTGSCDPIVSTTKIWEGPTVIHTKEAPRPRFNPIKSLFADNSGNYYGAVRYSGDLPISYDSNGKASYLNRWATTDSRWDNAPSYKQAAYIDEKQTLLGVNHDDRLIYMLREVTEMQKWGKDFIPIPYKWLYTVDYKSMEIVSNQRIPTDKMSFQLMESRYDPDTNAIVLITGMHLVFLNISNDDPKQLSWGTQKTIGNRRIITNKHGKPEIPIIIDTDNKRVYIAYADGYTTRVDGFAYDTTTTVTTLPPLVENNLSLASMNLIPSKNIILEGNAQSAEKVLLSVHPITLKVEKRKTIGAHEPKWYPDSLPVPVTDHNALYLVSEQKILQIDADSLAITELTYPPLDTWPYSQYGFNFTAKELLKTAGQDYEPKALFDMTSAGDATRLVYLPVLGQPTQWDPAPDMVFRPIPKETLRTLTFSCK